MKRNLQVNSGVGRIYAYMTFDEAEAMYGEEIRAKYREKLKAKREAKLKAQQEAKKANPQPQTVQIEQKSTEEMLQQKEEERKEKIRNIMKDIAERNHCKILESNYSHHITAFFLYSLGLLFTSCIVFRFRVGVYTIHMY